MINAWILGAIEPVLSSASAISSGCELLTPVTEATDVAPSERVGKFASCITAVSIFALIWTVYVPVPSVSLTTILLKGPTGFSVHEFVRHDADKTVVPRLAAALDAASSRCCACVSAGLAPAAKAAASEAFWSADLAEVARE